MDARLPPTERILKRHLPAAVPAGALISLGTKSKRASSSPLTHGGTSKKPKTEFIEVKACDLVVRTETALNAGEISLAESLILSALNQLRVNSGPTLLGPAITSSSAFRGSSGNSGSRLLMGFSLGLLVLAQSHPSLFSRVAVMDQLITLLALSPRELGISLPPAAVATITARARGLYVLVANIIYLALADQAKWPSHLVTIYLEDSLRDRVWVDQDECRAFVLNLETAFPKACGDPRGLFTILSSPAGGLPSSTTGSSGGHTASYVPNAVHSTLGLTCGSASVQPSADVDSTSSGSRVKDEIADAVSVVLKSQPISVAKIVHGSDINSLTVNRFESSRQAIEVMIASAMRDALSIRGGNTGATTPLINQGVGAAVTLASGSAAGPSVPVSGGSGDAPQLRNLIRTVAMAVGMPEIRGAVASRLEPWLTNPKVQLFSVGLLALLCANCKLGGLSAHDLDVMVSMVYRIRHKLLKPNIQAAFFECINYAVKAAPMNLYCLIHLCVASELKSPPLTVGTESKMASSSSQNVGNAVVKIAETVKSLAGEKSDEQSSSSLGSSYQHQQLASATVAAVAASASAAASRGSSSVFFILPHLYQKFTLQWVRIIGNLLHERLLLVATSSSAVLQSGAPPLTDAQIAEEVNSGLAPIYQFLRELAHASRSNPSDNGSHPTTLNTTTSQVAQQSYLPCAELTAALLQDRSCRGTTTASMAANAIIGSLTHNKDGKTPSDSSGGHTTSISVFQLYLNGLVSLVAALQLLSANRPYLWHSSNIRRTASHADAMKSHQTTLRQIRLAFIRWTKTILPLLVNATVQITEDASSIDSAIVHSLEALKPVVLIRRALMLDSVVPIHESGGGYELSSFYPVNSIWSNDQDRSSMVRLVTDVCLPEKLAHQLLILGLEPSWQLLSPLEAADTVCELIWRAALFTKASGVDGLGITKAEQLIDLLYASCTYVPEQQIPPEMAELAYASAYWKVSITAVILAGNCLQTCGLHLWSNYPTIRRLMEMVIIDDFTCPTDMSVAGRDASVIETERLNSEMEVQLILRLESLLLSSASGDSSTTPVVVTPGTSKLIGRLVRNNPRGPCRLPPPDQLNNLRFVAERLNLGRRMWRSRDPDFLLQLVRTQASNHSVVQPWLIRLVESSGSDFDLLPVQCLCEYFLCDTIGRLLDGKKEVNSTKWDEFLSNPHGGCTDSMEFTSEVGLLLEHKENLTSGSDVQASTNGTETSRLRHHLILKLREAMCTFGDVSASEALIHSFFTRLSDTRSLVRQAVRQCLCVLTSCDSTSFAGETFTDWYQVLRRLKQLPVLRADPNYSVHPGAVESLQHLFTSILASLHVESDLHILVADLLFLSRLTASDSFQSWRPVITSLSQFILTRSSILFSLLHNPSTEVKSAPAADQTTCTGYLTLEAMAEIFVRYIEYNCTAAEAIPVDENKSVFVAWSAERQCPLELDFIQAQLLLLTHISNELPTQPVDFTPELLDDSVDSSDRSWWICLRDIWFFRDPDSSDETCYHLPQMSPFLFPVPTFPHADSFGTSTHHLSFDRLVGDDQLSRPCLSATLRCALISTNQPPLVYGALWSTSITELVSTISLLPLFMLTENTLNILMEKLQQIVTGVDSSLRDVAQGMLSQLETVRSRNHSADSGLMTASEELIEVSEPLESESASDSGVDIPDHLREPVWSRTCSILLGLRGVSKTAFASKVLHTLGNSSSIRVAWLEQLNEELSIVTPPQPETKSVPVADEDTHGAGHTFLQLVASNPNLLELLLPLVGYCQAFGDSTTKKLRSTLDSLSQSLLLPRGLGEVLHLMFPSFFTGQMVAVSVMSPNSSDEAHMDQLVDLQELDHMELSSVSLLDAVCRYGLVEYVYLSPDKKLSEDTATDPNSMTDELVLSPVFGLVFEDSGSAGSLGVNCSSPNLCEYNKYLLTELLNQATPMFLRQCFYFLLRPDGTGRVNSTRALDFIMAVLTLPRLLYPVPRSEPLERPDSATFLASLHQFSLTEACRLIDYVVGEAREVVIARDPSDVDISGIIEDVLAKRTPLLDLALTRWPDDCLLYLELLSGFLQSPVPSNMVHSVDHLHEGGPTLGHPDWSLVAQQLLIHLYHRWPGLVDLLHSSRAKLLIYQLHSESPENSSLLSMPSTAFKILSAPHLEVDRLGSFLLVGLTSTNQVVSETAQLACKSLFIHHPRLCLCLLPVLAALSEGRLNVSWAQFTERRYHTLFATLLHLLELLETSSVDNGSELSPDQVTTVEISSSVLFTSDPSTYGPSVDRLLTNAIAMLAYFRPQVRRLGGFTSRLIKLLTLYSRVPAWRDESAHSGGLFRFEHNLRSNLELLATEYDDFGPVLKLFAQKLPTVSTTDYGSCLPTGPCFSHSLSDSVSRSNKRWSLAVVNPFIQRLKTCSRSQSITAVLDDLNNVSKRKVDVLLYFKTELERLIFNPDEAVCSFAYRLLLRLLNYYPRLAPNFIRNTILPRLSPKSREHNPISTSTLTNLPDFCLLAPHLAPKMLALCADYVMFAPSSELQKVTLRSIEEAVRRLTLDGVDTACIEHAASALISRTNSIKGTLLPS